jgi:hypothetical protein
MTSHLPEPNEHGTRAAGRESRGPRDDRHFQMRIAMIGAAGAIIAAAIGAVISLKPWVHSSSSSTTNGSSPTAMPSGTYRTHLGHALTLSNGVPVTIQLTGIIKPTGDSFFLNAGDRYLAAEFAVSDPSKEPVKGLKNFDEFTTAVGSDKMTYSPDEAGPISGCTRFFDGPDKIIFGQQPLTECVVFQIPTGVTVSEVEVTDGDELGIWSNP